MCRSLSVSNSASSPPCGEMQAPRMISTSSDPNPTEVQPSHRHCEGVNAHVRVNHHDCQQQAWQTALHLCSPESALAPGQTVAPHQAPASLRALHPTWYDTRQFVATRLLMFANSIESKHLCRPTATCTCMHACMHDRHGPRRNPDVVHLPLTSLAEAV